MKMAKQICQSLSKSTAGQHHGCTPSFNLRKSQVESYLKQLREGREEPELSTKLLRVVPERKTRVLSSTSIWKMHFTMVESSDRHTHGSCVPNEVPWSSCANRSGCQPSKRVECPKDPEGSNQQTNGMAGEKQHWRLWGNHSFKVSSAPHPSFLWMEDEKLVQLIHKVLDNFPSSSLNYKSPESPSFQLSWEP